MIGGGKLTAKYETGSDPSLCDSSQGIESTVRFGCGSKADWDYTRGNDATDFLGGFVVDFEDTCLVSWRHIRRCL